MDLKLLSKFKSTMLQLTMLQPCHVKFIANRIIVKLCTKSFVTLNFFYKRWILSKYFFAINVDNSTSNLSYVSPTANKR